MTTRDRRGFARYEWQKMRANEQLDLNVYSRAALCLMGSDRYGDRFWTSLQREPPQAAQPPVPAVEQQLAIGSPTPQAAPPPPRSPTVTVTQQPQQPGAPVRRSIASRLA